VILVEISFEMNPTIIKKCFYLREIYELVSNVSSSAGFLNKLKKHFLNLGKFTPNCVAN
jgi:hypothetical protein